MAKKVATIFLKEKESGVRLFLIDVYDGDKGGYWYSGEHFKENLRKFLANPDGYYRNAWVGEKPDFLGGSKEAVSEVLPDAGAELLETLSDDVPF